MWITILFGFCSWKVFIDVQVDFQDEHSSWVLLRRKSWASLSRQQDHFFCTWEKVKAAFYFVSTRPQQLPPVGILPRRTNCGKGTSWLECPLLCCQGITARFIEIRNEVSSATPVNWKNANSSFFSSVPLWLSDCIYSWKEMNCEMQPGGLLTSPSLQETAGVLSFKLEH